MAAATLEQAKGPRARILLCGLPKCGKSSIGKVVFAKTPPHETLFLEPTKHIVPAPVDHNPLVNFDVYDFPGNINYDAVESHIDADINVPQAVCFVVDAQDEPYTEALDRCSSIFHAVYRKNNKVNFNVFIHKVDGELFLVEDHKAETQTDIHTRLIELLFNTQGEHAFDGQVFFHCTSIYDHSLFEAMSKVVQSLMPELPELEELLDCLVTNCRIEKGFLFDVVSKIYIASDSQPVDVSSYELCADMIDVVIDVSCIYGLDSDDDMSVAYDSNSSCLIHLRTGIMLYLKQVEHFLAFAGIIRAENFDRQHLLDYNIDFFKTTLLKVRKGT